MPRKRLAVASLTGAAIGIGYSAYRRRRKCRPNRFETVRIKPVRPVGLIRPALVYLLASNATGVSHFGSNWVNAGLRWWGTLSGFADAVLGIVGFVTQPIVSLVQAVWNEAISVINTLGPLLDVFNDALTLALNRIGYLAYQFDYYLDEWVLPIVEPLLNPIRTWLSNLQAYIDIIWDEIAWFVESTVGPLVDAAIDFAIGGILDILREVQEFLDDPIGYITNIVTDIVQSLIDAALDALTFSATLAAQIVSLGLQTLLGVTEDVIDILRKAWDFLVFVATHPEDVLTQIVESAIRELVQDAYNAIADTVNDNADDIERLVSNMLGIDL